MHEPRGSRPRPTRHHLATVVDWIRTIPRWQVAVGAGYVLLRVVAVAGVGSEGWFPDSETYRQGAGTPAHHFVSLTGHAMRAWFAPLFYAVMPNDGVRAAVQVAVSIAAWLTLAVVIELELRDHRVRFFAFVVVLALSCTLPVLSWDVAMLSESLAISLGVLALAGWIRFVRLPTWPNVVAVLAAMTAWTFTKWGLFPVVGAAAVFVLAWALRWSDRAKKLVVGVVLLAVAGWGWAAAANSDRVRETVGVGATILFSSDFAERLRLEILGDPKELAWFLDHGMPGPSGLEPYRRASPADDGVAGRPAFYAAYMARADLRRWVEQHGRGVYTRYVLAHPGRVISDFARELPWMLVPPRSSIVYTSGPRAVLPGAVESLLFDATETPTKARVAVGDVALLAAACLVLALWPARRRRATDTGLLAIAGALLVLGLMGLAVAWVGSARELARHALPSSVLVRLALWLALFALVDGLVAGPDDAPEPAEPMQ